MQRYFGSNGSDGMRLHAGARAEIAEALRGHLAGLLVYEESVTAVAGGVVLAARDSDQRTLIVCGEVEGFAGVGREVTGVQVLLCDADEPNMAALRGRISWLRPS